MTAHVKPGALKVDLELFRGRPRAVVKVAADLSDPKVVLAELNKSFETLKAGLDDKIKARADVLITEHIDRVNATVGDLQAMVDEANARLAAIVSNAGSGEKPIAGADPEYNALFSAYFRSGAEEHAVKAASVKGPRAAMSVGVPADGGLTAPVEWDRQIIDKLKIISPLRQIAQVQPISVGGFFKLWNNRATTSGWVAETDPRPQTANAQFAQISFPIGTIYAMPAATQQLLEDSLVDIEAWLANEVDVEFAYQEGLGFVNGDGVNKPKGLLQYTAAPSHPAGAIPTVISGAAADLTYDGLVNLVYDLPSERTPAARFVMNRSTIGKIRLMKDTQNRPLWEPSVQVGEPSTLLGFPITEIAAMPSVAANAIPVMFGDFNRGYLIIDRVGTRVLRDPYTAKPYVLFYTTKRVGGGVQDPTVLRYHKIASA